MQEAIAIIGTGRLGKSLAVALCEAGRSVVALSDRNLQKAIECAGYCSEKTRVFALQDLPADLSLVLLAVPDDAIPAMVKKLCRIMPPDPERVVAHHSGSLASDILSPLSSLTPLLASLHPIQTFSGADEDWKRLFGIVYGLEGHPRAVEILRTLVESLHSRAILIRAQDKSLYHLGCVLAANYLVGLESLAIQVFEILGLTEAETVELLEPLIVASLDNIKRLGPVHALTGPITRGDVGTIAKHLTEIEKNMPELLAVYLSLGQQLLRLAGRQERSDSAGLKKIEELFSRYRF
ncbi:DUF2520 domain-containing protein [candidate division KSB1 bacterium]|nr:DUF2520 domain-containing protein [candidate division KSB1 bacterium]